MYLFCPACFILRFAELDCSSSHAIYFNWAKKQFFALKAFFRKTPLLAQQRNILIYASARKHFPLVTLETTETFVHIVVADFYSISA
jgi:hypothetical protein